MPIAYLRNRFVAELPLWHLHYWQCGLLILWSAWPWLALSIFPGNETLALAHVIVLLPIAYLVGGLLSAAMPNFAYAYHLGVSATIFSISYLVMVGWRQRRNRRRI